MIPLALWAAAACLGVGGGADRIMGRDLAPAFPALAAAAGDAALGFAPAPGVQRIFHRQELLRLAARWGLKGGPAADICVERRSAPLDPARLLDAMRRALPQARIEILDISRQAAPEGEMDFPRSGLRETPAGGFWRGCVRYGGGKRFAIWARVRVRAEEPRVIAAEELKAGLRIEARQLKVDVREVFPAAPGFAASAEEVAGRIPRRGIEKGTSIRTAWLDPPRDVRRGEVVRVVSVAGAARIEAEAVAQASGSAGDVIPLENPVSKRRFRGRVEGKGRVSANEGGL